jgi:CDP-glycerol glycerophosphotransferase
VYLVLRPHASERFTVSTRLRFAVRDVSDTVDASDYLAASDLLISDYSSIIGDAALAGVPVCLYQPDREVYVNRTRGVYVGSDTVGPIVKDTDELVAAVGQWLDSPLAWDTRHGPGLRDFAVQRCGPDDGGSAARAVAAMLATAAGGAT